MAVKATAKSDTKKRRVSSEEFVRIWQHSNNIAEVAAKTRMHLVTLRARACRYRALGVPLKAMQRPKLLNVEKLIKIAEET